MSCTSSSQCPASVSDSPAAACGDLRPIDWDARRLEPQHELVVFLHGGDDMVRVQWRLTRPQPQNDVARPLMARKCRDWSSRMPPTKRGKW